MALLDTALNQQQRLEDLAALRNEEFDILVIGAGVTGSGIAIDAAARGLKVALVEAKDFAWPKNSSLKALRG